jgi:rare lipoprotein A
MYAGGRSGWFLALLGIFAIVLVGCSSDRAKHASKSRKLDPFAGTGSPYYKGKGPLPEGGGKYHVGKPYQVAGRWYTPREQPNYDKKGMASWYGEAFHARRTSNGEWFDMGDLTAAHPTLPLPSYAKVTNLENGRTVVVRINDRGPFVGTRLIDLSKRTSDVLGFRHKGKSMVRVQWIAEAPLNDKGYRHLAMMNTEMKSGSSIRQMAGVAERNAPSDMRVAAASEVDEPGDEPVATTVAYKTPLDEPEPTFVSAGYVVHVATFGKRANADAAYEYLSEMAEVQMFQFEGGESPLYRLQTVSVADSQEAEELLEKLVSAGFPDAKIRRVRVQQVAAKIAG